MHFQPRCCLRCVFPDYSCPAVPRQSMLWADVQGKFNRDDGTGAVSTSD